MQKIIRHFPSFPECHQAIFELLKEHTRSVLRSASRYSLALSGGRTPVELFKFLGMEGHREEIQWQDVLFFWSDERYVPATDPASNYRMAKTYLLDHLLVSDDHIFQAPTQEPTYASAAFQYQKDLCRAFSVPPPSRGEGKIYPRFDLIMLGMGADGHTASLFPGHPALQSAEFVVGVESEYAVPPIPRLTFTLPLLNSADTVLFMVHGTDKVRVLESFNDLKRADPMLPASLVAPEQRLLWFIVD